MSDAFVTLAAYMLIGRLAIWLVQIAGPLQWLWKRTALLTELVECDLCLGFWVYSILAGVFRLNIMPFSYIAVVSEIGTGAIMAFIAHLLRIGWATKFQVVVLEE